MGPKILSTVLQPEVESLLLPIVGDLQCHDQLHVADSETVLMLKRITAERGSKALLVLPYVALVQEKVQWLRSVVRGLHLHETTARIMEDKRIWRRRADEGTIRVIGFFGGGKIRATWDDFEIGVCTLEKVSLPAESSGSVF